MTAITTIDSHNQSQNDLTINKKRGADLFKRDSEYTGALVMRSDPNRNPSPNPKLELNLELKLELEQEFGELKVGFPADQTPIRAVFWVGLKVSITIAPNKTKNLPENQHPVS